MNPRTAAAPSTRPLEPIAAGDVMAEQPKHCEDCGAVVISLLLNNANGTRRWVPARWDSTTRAWVRHRCEDVTRTDQ